MTKITAMSRIFTTETGCWEIIGSNTRYPKARLNGRRIGIHRVLCSIFNGQMRLVDEACHSCDNPKCIRPEHIFKATHVENMQDASRKGRMSSPKGIYRRAATK